MSARPEASVHFPASDRQLIADAQSERAHARDRLVAEFMPLIGSVARIYRGSPDIDHDELMQEGVVGLLRALERFNPELGTPFWAYASWWVRQAMQHLVAELGRPVVLSDRAARHLALVKQTQRRHQQGRGCDATLAELSEQTGIARTDIEKLLAAERPSRGLQEPVGFQDGGLTVGDQLADPSAEEEFEALPVRLGARDVGAMMNCLDDRERAVLRGRFGLDGDERTLREMGAVLGVSAERVRQIEQRALEKLRH